MHALLLKLSPYTGHSSAKAIFMGIRNTKVANKWGFVGNFTHVSCGYMAHFFKAIREID